MDRLTKLKVESLIESDNFEISGQVLVKKENGQRAIVEMSAVRWLTNDEMWALMHPKQENDTVNHEGKMYSLVPCPFCGSGSFSIRPLGRIWNGMGYGPPNSVEVMHHCDPTPGQPSRPIIRVGRDIQSAIDAWNQRK